VQALELNIRSIQNSNAGFPLRGRPNISTFIQIQWYSRNPISNHHSTKQGEPRGIYPVWDYNHTFNMLHNNLMDHLPDILPRWIKIGSKLRPIQSKTIIMECEVVGMETTITRKLVMSSTSEHVDIRTKSQKPTSVSENARVHHHITVVVVQ